MIIEKILGALSIVFGFFMIFFFPDLPIWQTSGFWKLAIILGVIFILAGIYLIRI
jgi:hypothetical protein